MKSSLITLFGSALKPKIMLRDFLKPNTLSDQSIKPSVKHAHISNFSQQTLTHCAN